MPITPVNSTIGKYFAEIRTVSRFASYCCSFVRPKRRIQPALLAERLHDPDALEALLQRREVLADRLAHLEVGDVRAPPEPAGRDHHRRDDHEHAEAELPAQREDHDHRADEDQEVLDEHHEPGADELLQRVDVGGHARHEPAGLLPVEEVERERRDVAEHLLAQRAEEPLAGPAHQPDHPAAEHEAEDRDDEVRDRGAVQRGGVLRRRARRRRRRAPSAGPASRHAVWSDEHDGRDDHLPPVRTQHPARAGAPPGARRRGRAGSRRRPGSS